MKVTQEKLPASQVGLEIEITPEMSKQAYEKTLQDLLRNVNIPGFRKGKVPRQVLIQRFGSLRIKAAAVEDLIESSLKQAVEQEKIDAIGQFELKSAFDELVSQFEPGSALTFSAAVDVPPVVEVSDYKGLVVKAEEVKYDPTKVDELLDSYRNRSAILVPVEGRAAQEKDVAVVDFTGKLLPDEGAEAAEAQDIPGGSAQDFEIELTEGKFIAGFIEGIIGMTSGETKDVAVTFPEGYPQEDLAGKAAVFSITLKELKEKELPELDDDFAQDVSEFETLAELRESIEAKFQKEAEQKTTDNKQEALVNELVKHVQVDLPETLIKQETDYMLTQTAMQLSRQGIDVKQLFTQEMIAQMRERSRPDAVLRLQRTLALGEIAKRESLLVEPEALAAKVSEVQADLESEDVDIERLTQAVEEDLLKEKIFGWLEANGTVELVPEGSLAPEPDAVDAPVDSPVAADATIDAVAEVVTDDASDAAAASTEVSDSDSELAEAAIASDEPTEPSKSGGRKKTTRKAPKEDTDASSGA